MEEDSNKDGEKNNSRVEALQKDKSETGRSSLRPSAADIHESSNREQLKKSAELEKNPSFTFSGFRSKKKHSAQDVMKDESGHGSDNPNPLSRKNSRQSKAHSSKRSLTSSLYSRDGFAYKRYWRRFWESEFVRNCKILIENPFVELLFSFFVFAACSVVLILGITIIPNTILSSISLYNEIHIVEALISHLYLVVGLHILGLIKDFNLAAELASRSVTIQQLMASSTSTKAINGRNGTIKAFLMYFVVIFVILFSLNLDWTPVNNDYFSGSCIPAEYHTNSLRLMSGAEQGTFFQGESDFALIYHYGLPLADGIIGGWSSWPLEQVSNLFDLESPGSLFLIRVECLPFTSSDVLVSSLATKIGAGQQTYTRNIIQGKMDLFFPPGSYYQDDDRVNGTKQTCFYEVMQGLGVIQYEFIADEWNMITLSGIKRVTVGNTTLSAYATTDRYSGEFRKSVNQDPWGFTPVIARNILSVFNDTAFYSSQGATFCNIFQWGTYPDGFYHEEAIFKGVASSLAILNHYLLMQYNGSATGTCTYVSYSGSGIPTLKANYIVPLIITAIAITYFISIFDLGIIYIKKGFYGPHVEVLKALRNRFRMAHDMHEHGSAIFNKVDNAQGIHNFELLEKYEDTVIAFGAEPNGAGDKLRTNFGLKRQVIPLKKHFAKKAKHEASGNISIHDDDDD